MANNEDAALFWGLVLGLPILVIWLIVGTIFIRRDMSNRASTHASLLCNDFHKQKKAQEEGHLKRERLRYRITMILNYATLSYEFVALTSFAFAPSIPWPLPETFKTVVFAMSLITIKIPGLSAIWSFWIIVGFYWLCGLITLVYMLYRWCIGKYRRVEQGNKVDVEDGNDEVMTQARTRKFKPIRRIFGMISRFLPQIMFELALIPVMRVFLEMISCSVDHPDIICWEGNHLIYAIVAVASFCALYPIALYWALNKNSLIDKVQYIPRASVLFVMASVLACVTTTLMSSIVSLSTTCTTIVLLALLVYVLVSQPALGSGVVFNHIKSASLMGASYASCLGVAVIVTEHGFSITTSALAGSSGQEWPVYAFIIGIVPLMIIAALLSLARSRSMEKRSLQDISAMSTCTTPITASQAHEVALNAANLAIIEEKRSHIVAHGGIDAMLKLLQLEYGSETLQHAARALSNMTALDIPTRQMVYDTTNTIIKLIDLLDSSISGPAKAQVCRVFYHLSLSRSIRASLLKDHGKMLSIAVMNGAMQRESESYAISCCRLLTLLTADDQWGKVSMKNRETHPKVMATLLTNAFKSTQPSLLIAINNMVDAKIKAVVGDGALLRELAALYDDDDAHVQTLDKTCRNVMSLGPDERVDMDRVLRVTRRGRAAQSRLRSMRQ